MWFSSDHCLATKFLRSAMMDVPEQQPHILNLNHTSRNTTLNATHSTIDFHPVCTATNCEEWRYATYRRNGSLPMTFRHTNNYHRQHTLEIGWKLSFRGTHIFVYGAPVSLLPETPGSAEFCVNEDCSKIDLYDTYSHASGGGPVLLVMRDNLDPSSFSNARFTPLARPTTRNDNLAIHGITLQEVVITEVDVPLIITGEGLSMSKDSELNPININETWFFCMAALLVIMGVRLLVNWYQTKRSVPRPQYSHVEDFDDEDQVVAPSC